MQIMPSLYISPQRNTCLSTDDFVTVVRETESHSMIQNGKTVAYANDNNCDIYCVFVYNAFLKKKKKSYFHVKQNWREN